MKKFLSFLLTFVMLFSLTMPAMAAEITGNTENPTEGEVSATFTPDIKLTGMEYVGEEATYNADTNTYTVVIPAGTTSNVSVGVKLTGTNLDLAEGCTHLQLREFSSAFGDSKRSTEELLSREFKSGFSTKIDGFWVNYQYSNDGGTTWSDEILRIEVKHGYSVTVNESTNGSVSADKTLVAPGDTVSLNVSPAEGYELNTLTVTDADGGNVTVENNQFTMPAKAVTVTATFKEAPKTYTVTIDENITNGTVSVDPSSYTAGQTVTLIVDPADEYQLGTLTVNDGAVTVTKVDDTTYTFTMPAAEVTVNATFELIPPTVTKVTLTVDGVETDLSRITSATQTLTLNLYGTYLNREGWRIEDSQYNRYSNEAWQINDDGTYATLSLDPAQFANLGSDTVFWNRFYSSASSSVQYIDNFAELLYMSDPGTDLEVIYFNAGELSTYVSARFEDCYGYEIAIYADMTPVDGENGIFYIAVPQYADVVQFRYEGVRNSSEFEIPMAADGTDMYTPGANGADGIWTKFARTFSITNATNDTNGTLTAPETAKEGETVTLTWTVDSAYKLSNIVVKDADGNEVTFTDKGLTAWTFVMPSSAITVTATFEKIPVTSAEIVWGSMSFSYDDTINEATGKEKGWSPDSADGAATVTVKNTGETTFTAQATYTPYEGYESITGSFDPASKELAPPSGEQAGEEYTFTLVLSGKPTKALSGEAIGKVTITINEAAEG